MSKFTFTFYIACYPIHFVFCLYVSKIGKTTWFGVQNLFSDFMIPSTPLLMKINRLCTILLILRVLQPVW